jgi:hypothetical protein
VPRVRGGAGRRRWIARDALVITSSARQREQQALAMGLNTRLVDAAWQRGASNGAGAARPGHGAAEHARARASFPAARQRARRWIPQIALTPQCRGRRLAPKFARAAFRRTGKGSAKPPASRSGRPVEPAVSESGVRGRRARYGRGHGAPGAAQVQTRPGLTPKGCAKGSAQAAVRCSRAPACGRRSGEAWASGRIPRPAGRGTRRRLPRLNPAPITSRPLPNSAPIGA